MDTKQPIIGMEEVAIEEEWRWGNTEFRIFNLTDDCELTRKLTPRKFKPTRNLIFP